MKSWWTIAQVSIFLFMAAMWLVSMSVHAPARSSFRGAPLPYSCAQVRWATSVFSIPHLKALGKKMGVVLTPAQVREAQKCLQAGVNES